MTERQKLIDSIESHHDFKIIGEPSLEVLRGINSAMGKPILEVDFGIVLDMAEYIEGWCE